MSGVTIWQRWQCDDCQLEGIIRGLSTDDALGLYRLAIREHEEKSPECRGRLRFRDEYLTREPTDARLSAPTR
jgi:hypothetical protein